MENREEIAKKYNIDLSKVKQVFFICFENCRWYDFLEILDKIGEYKASSAIAGDKIIDYAYSNTNLEASQIAEEFNQYKLEEDKISIVGLTLDMMMEIGDSEDREWCYSRQEATMRYIISKQQKEVNRNIEEIIEKIQKEVLNTQISQEKAENVKNDE